ncbi:MAG: lamin tail domain-containing protein [Nocardioides sp.]
MHSTSRRLRTALAAVLTALLTVLATLALAPAAGAATGAVPCSTSGTWRQGELNVYWFDVEQGDSQLIVGPTGKTMLIDLGETAYSSKGTSTNASRVAAQIESICGTGTAPVALDYVMASHHHLDHIGYAGNPNDTTAYGNGLYQLLTPTGLGGLGFGVGQFFDHDGGTWTDANGDKDCDVGTSAAPANEIAWHNVGTTSATASRFICWLYGPAGQPDRAEIAGKVTTLTNSSVWPTIDLGGGASGKVVEANAKGVMEADGTTPVSGNHSTDATPPSENDYSVGLKVTFGTYSYATAGDSDGEYTTSANGYTYNNVESKLISVMGTATTVRANHHGSSHSSSDAYVQALKPQTSVISCGANSFGHPSNHTLNAFRTIGADIYLTNDPCDTTDDTGATIDYSGTFNHNGTIHLATQNAGADYTVQYDAGTKSYVTGNGSTTGDPTKVKVNEFMPAPSSGNEWVELYNPTAQVVDVSGYYVDDVAGGGGAPKQIPSGTTIPAGGRWVFEFASGFLNNTGSDSARFTDPSGTQIDGYDYSLSSTHYDQVFHRAGDGGAWCATVSTNVTKGTANPTTCP